MQHLEPTYLRYVYDGLSKGSISSNNPTSLPIGFIGLFEDEFPSSMPLVERMTILNRLATWALLKGPVSIEMVAEVLNEHPDKTKALIDTYSKWFNSPEPGKYVLYHDRLRTYLLQKLSNHEIQDLNEVVISYLEKSLADERGDESELYALEHLSTHMLVESQLDNNYERLHEFVNRDDLWERQITTSNEYKWSQRSVQYAIKEGARRHHEMNTLSSTVNSVKLMQEEKNNINQILNLLTEGNYKTALRRALFFSGEKLITVNFLMINELLINEKQTDNYKLKVYKNIIEIIKTCDIEQKDFPAILIYNFYLEFKRLSLDYSVLLEKYSFEYYDILYLLEFDGIDIIEIEYLVENFIHYSDYPDIYIAISKFYLDKNNRTKTIHYLEKSLKIISKIPVSYGQYYNFIDNNEYLNDKEYYRTIIRWKLLIAFIYYDIEQYNSSEQILNDILLLVNEFSDEIEEKIMENITISTNTWFDIFSLCFLLEKYELVINSKWFKHFISFNFDMMYINSRPPSLLKVLVTQKKHVQFEKFIELLKDNDYDRKIICEMDYMLLLYDLDKIQEAEKIKSQIIAEINSLNFGRVKFDALIYFIEILFKTGKFSKGNYKIADQVIEVFFLEIKRLNNQNSNFYFGLINDLIKTCFRQSKTDKALEIYSTYLSEINEKNSQDPTQKHNFSKEIFKTLLTHNYKTPSFLIDKLKGIGTSKNYYDLYETIFLDFISRGFIYEAIIFTNKYNIKNKTFPEMVYPMQQYGIVLNTKLFSEIKNSYSKTYELISTSDSRIYNWKEEIKVIPYKNLKKLGVKYLKQLISLSIDNCYDRHYRELTLLELMGQNSELQNYLIDKLKEKVPVFEYNSNDITSGYYRSADNNLSKLKYLNPSYVDINYLILNELSINMKWNDLEQIIDRFKFDYHVGAHIPFFLGKLNSTNELVLERAFFNIKLKILLNILTRGNDISLVNRLFELCSSLPKNAILKTSRGHGNFSSIGFIQLSNVLNQIGLTELAMRAINEAFIIKNEDLKSSSPTYSQIIKVFIHICMSSLDDDRILNEFSKIITRFNFYSDDWKKDESPEELLFLFVEPLIQIGQTHKAGQVVDMILKIIEKIPIKHFKMLYIEDGMELPNTVLARKQKSISNISYFYYFTGDFKKGDEYYNMLSDELIYDSDTFYGDTHYQVGFDRDEIKNKFKNKTLTIYEKVISENTTLEENELEFNGAVYKDLKDRKIMESNFDYSFTKNNIEFHFLSKNQNPHESLSYLFYKAKMACFFEEHKNDNKLDLLEQVIDIKQWREVKV